MNEKNNMAIMPMWDYILLEHPQGERRIELPDNVKAEQINMLELEVLQVGPDCMNVRQGDRIMFDPRTAIEITPCPKEKYYLVSERNTHVIAGALRELKATRPEKAQEKE